MLTEYRVVSRSAVHVVHFAELLQGGLPGVVDKLGERVSRSQFVQHRATHSRVCDQQVDVAGFALDPLGSCLEGFFTRHVPDKGDNAGSNPPLSERFKCFGHGWVHTLDAAQQLPLAWPRGDP